MKLTYDVEADAAYLPLVQRIGAGEAVAQVVVNDPRLRGQVSLDLDGAGFLLGVEVIGARKLLRSDTLKPSSPST